MIMRSHEFLGILGGMGPESTAVFYRQIIRQCQLQYGAVLDEHYPRILIYNLPIPDIVNGVADRSRTIEQLAAGAQFLQQSGVTVLTVPCNTAHIFYPEIAAHLTIPFLHLIEEVANDVSARGLKSVGLLATETTVSSRIYEVALSKRGISVIYPRDQSQVTAAILSALSGEKEAKCVSTLNAIGGDMMSDGVEGVILGCTDLPVLTGEWAIKMPVIDSIEVLARRTVQYLNNADKLL
jgi:aspartate racemase